jgi:6-phosphofructokinase 1
MAVSGGDAPGINAVLARYTALAAARGDEVVGAIGGFSGVMDEQLIPLTTKLMTPWEALPGSFLPSSREPVLGQSGAREKLTAILARHAIDNLVVFGGDGTLRYIPPLLREWGIPCIGLPTTIDNDIAGTDQTLGFDSACNYAYQAVDGILATGHALHNRIFMIETLGGHTGFLAVDIAFGARAHAVLVPEYAYENDWLAQRLLATVEQAGYALLVLSEGVAASRRLAEDIPNMTGIRVRDTRLGHAQRGARPTHKDRVLAAHMARTAYQAFSDKVMMGTVVVRDGHIMLHEGAFEGFPPRLPDRALYDFVNGFED